jgi:putative membrane protein
MKTGVAHKTLRTHFPFRSAFAFLLLAFLAGFLLPYAPRLPGYAIGSLIAMLLLALPSVIGLVRWLGAARGTLLLAALAAFAYAIETVGLLTGFPYTHFAYTDALGPKLFGVTPLLLPLAYVPLVLGALWLARRERVTPWRFLVLVALALFAVDFVLDPGAVAMGFWTFETTGVYYGVPALNFAGWLFSGLLAGSIALAFVKTKRAPPALLVSSMLLSLAFWSGVALAQKLWIPLVLGCALIVGFLRVITASSSRRQRRRAAAQ